jgi:lipid A 3-O-deacylase
MWVFRVRILTASLYVVISLVCSVLAVEAADFSSLFSPKPIIERTSGWEVRGGVFAHGGQNNLEGGTADLNTSVVSPRLWFVSAGWWAPFIPRIQIGGFLNLGGKTSAAYTDALWRMPIWGNWFAEGFIGPAIHNGSLTMDQQAGQAGLGCRWLFHAGGSVGYRYDDHWSVMGTFEHLSNGRGLLGTDCGTNALPNGNQGLNNYGARVGYTF